MVCAPQLPYPEIGTTGLVQTPVAPWLFTEFPVPQLCPLPIGPPPAPVVPAVAPVPVPPLLALPLPPVAVLAPAPPLADTALPATPAVPADDPSARADCESPHPLAESATPS